MSDTFEFLSPQQSDRPYTVSEINEGISLLLESGNTLIWVEGEISNWKPSSSGHYYFRLKDSACQIPAVIWRSSAEQLSFKPQDGVAVMAIGSIRVYQKGGYYQLDIHRMQPLGCGALHAAFEKLKNKLEQEGLFDISHKKTIPESITTLGIVTSKRGAAIQDMVRVISSRAPQTDIILIDVPVQGETAPAAIAAAIRDLNDYRKVDCIIVGRGGGSIEDLWAFNEEIVARAIYESEIPVISAVGHEIDFTIADFVADVRAPTPSAAAEIVVADNKESRRYFTAYAERFRIAFQRYYLDIQDRFNSLCKRNALRNPLRMLRESNQYCDDLEHRYLRGFEMVLKRDLSRLSSAASRLNSLSPLSVLARGYSVVTNKDGKAVRNSNQLSAGEAIKLRFFEGSALGSIISVDSDKKNDVAF
ncbi:MAG TPA: exodeoxyribonuclease VII large subunit [Chitinispirillaceae bacterium]|nr:exodeoxyribonuclease VII large subunit [Chitinispirillaceae bacterium]